MCLTGPQQLESPFFTCFSVQEVMGWHVAKVRRYLAEQKIGQVEIKPRGVKIDVDGLARQFRTDGQGRRTLFILRFDKKVVCVVCQRVKGENLSGS